MSVTLPAVWALDAKIANLGQYQIVFPSQVIEPAATMAYGSRTVVASYADKKMQVRFLYGSA